MNLKSIIKPLIFGRKSVNDDNWSIKFTVTNCINESNVRIQCQNTFEIKTKMDKIKVSSFKLILFINQTGDISFNRITIGEGNLSHQAHRIMMKDELYRIFRPSIESYLRGDHG